MMKKTALVTGADGGMGTIHTRTLAQAGYEVIMACYDKEVAKPVCEKIASETGATLHLMQVDLGNLDDIIRFANEVKAQFSRLDILLNNAGVLCHGAKNSVNGIEYTAAVNYLGHYTLTNALLPIITVIGMQIPTLFGGAVIVEQMFSWPGLGQVTWDAVLSRNYPVIMGVCLLSAVVVLAANLVTDILYALVDPTIQY